MTRVELDITSSEMVLEITGDDAVKHLKNILKAEDLPDEPQYVSLTVLSELPEDDEQVEPPALEAPEPEPELKIRSARRMTILKTMARKPDQFWHTPEVRNHLPEDHEIAEGSVSKILYALADDGFLDKQDSDRNQRMKKYKLTSRGLKALEESKTS